GYAVEPDPPPQDGEVMLHRVAVEAADERVEKTVIRGHRIGDLGCVGLCPAFDVSPEEPVGGENLQVRAVGSTLGRRDVRPPRNSLSEAHTMHGCPPFARASCLTHAELKIRAVQPEALRAG